MGDERLELAGYSKGKIGKVDMMEFKKIAEDAGLKIVSSHVNPAIEGVPFLRDYTKELTPKIMEYWKATAADHAKLGCKYLIQPMMPNIPNHDAAKLVCDIFNQASDVIKAEGIATGTDPSKVYFEMDVYWTVMGQNDPVEYMQKYANRIKVLHIKDRAVFGQSGMMNFEMIFKQMYANGIQDYFVELEKMPDGRTQFAGVKDCAAYLQNAPFVK